MKDFVIKNGALIEYMGEDASVVIPEGVTRIGNSVFLGCSQLIDVVIPNTVVKIGNSAFFDTGLQRVTIPESVIEIGESAFGYCQDLMSISVDKNNANYKDIDGNLYSKDGKTLLQYAAGKTESEFMVPDGVCVVGACAFDGAQSLTCIETPSSVVQIEDHAFTLCENLANLSILGPKTKISDLALEGRDDVIILLTEDNDE